MGYGTPSAAAMMGGRVIGNAAIVEGGSRAVFTSAALPLSSARAGDLMVGWFGSTGQTTTILGGSASDWTYSNVIGNLRLAWKVLSQADIDASLSLSSNVGESVFEVYRGPIAAAVRGFNSGAHPFNVAGFTKGGWCAGLVGLQWGNNSPGFISGWTVRQSASGGSPAGIIIGDLLTPSSYTDGAAISFSGSNSGAGIILELLNY